MSINNLNPSAAKSSALTIVLLNWNQPASTLSVLESLEESKFLDFNVYLVDNGSSSLNREKLRCQVKQFAKSAKARGSNSSFPVEILQSKTNLGYAGGCNLGIRKALGNGASWVLILNNDLKIESDGIGTMLEVAKNSQKVIVGARVLNTKGDQDIFTGKRWPNLLLGLGDQYSTSEIVTSHSSRIMYSDYVEGSAVLLSSQFLNEKQSTDGYYFDPNYFLYCEDSDLCLWAKSHNYRCVVAWEAKIFHCVGGSFHEDKLGLRYYYLTRNRIHLANRWLTNWQLPLFHLYYLISRCLLQLTMTRYSMSERWAILVGIKDGYANKGGKWIRHLENS